MSEERQGEPPEYRDAPGASAGDPVLRSHDPAEAASLSFAIFVASGDRAPWPNLRDGLEIRAS